MKMPKRRTLDEMIQQEYGPMGDEEGDTPVGLGRVWGENSMSPRHGKVASGKVGKKQKRHAFVGGGHSDYDGTGV